ncbi:MAG: protein tyrosine phosphatase family protein [Proteobacteria bacterium]|nr:protein tyrosine phosphatase family protein [Pseudomonadota bacterium]
MQQPLNFYQITDRIGTAGQPSIEQLAAIAKQGVANVVNLAMHDSDNALADEGSIVASLGMSYFHLPVPFDKPGAGHVRKFFSIMDALESEKVFVHCALNLRVSAFMHQYLTLKKGLSSEQASSPLLSRWFPDMDDAWKSIMNLSLDEIER